MGFVKVKKEQEREGEKVKKLGRFLKAFFGVVCVIYVAVFILSLIHISEPTRLL